MKNIILAILAIALCVGTFYYTYKETGPNKDVEKKEEVLDDATQKRVDELAAQIEKNNESGAHSANIALYDELIDINSQNIDWYIGFAETYQKLGKSSKHKNMCKKTVRLFPEDPRGYMMLMEFYASKGDSKHIVKTYLSAPDTIKNNTDVSGFYQNYEWAYRVKTTRSDSVSDYSGNMYVRQKKDFFTYQNGSLYAIISKKFDTARPFIEDYAAVSKEGQWYFIDLKGNKALTPNLPIDDMYSFSNGYAVARINGSYGYINNLSVKYSFNYEDATSFYNEVAAVKKNGKWALINTSFNTITGFVFDDVIRDDANVCSRYGSIWLKTNGLYYLYDLTGNKINSTGYSDARPFYSEYAVAQKNGLWGVVDQKGNIVMDFKYTNASSCASGIVAVEKDGKWGCVDLKGNTVVDFVYKYASVTSDAGVVIAQTSNKYKFIKFYKFS